MHQTNQVLIHGPCPTNTYSTTNCYSCCYYYNTAPPAAAIVTATHSEVDSGEGSREPGTPYAG